MLRRGPLIAGAAALLLAITIGWPMPAAAQTQGASCTTNGTTAPGTVGSSANNLICVSGTWQYPVYVFQSAAAAAGSSCSTYPAGAMRYNTTLSNVEFCNGTVWEEVPAYSSSCGTPSGLSFTNVSSASLNTVYTSSSATITFSGCSSALSVSVSGAATAQISVNGGAWATSGAILSGQTLQVRLTSSGSVSTGLTATVTIGSTSANWTVTTRSGSLSIFETPSSYIAGSLGGLSGANSICQTAANTAGYSGTYVAILSSDTTSAASNLTLSYPIVNAYDGSTVASSNLWIGSLNGNIKTPSGSSPAAPVWTGSTASGGIDTGKTCTSWSSTSGAGMWGEAFSTASQWIANCDSCNACSSAEQLYCIQQ